MPKAILIFLILGLTSISYSQKHGLKDMDLNKLKEKDQNPVLLLSLNEKNEFRLPNTEGDYKAHKQKLKSYILVNKTKANISLDKNKHGDNFDKYQKCFFEVGKIYEEIWEEQSKSKYGKSFNKLKIEEKESITKEYPLNFK